MAKKCSCPKPTGEIPAWFMTYSDVITLLMTFFILLLTFSTTEPERFEKVRSSKANIRCIVEKIIIRFTWSTTIVQRYSTIGR